jgi:hypothetical protein
MPATPPPSTDSDVFSTPVETTNEAPPKGPLDGGMDLGSMEVTAPGVEPGAPDSDFDADITEGDEVSAGNDSAEDWQDKATEVSELAGNVASEPETDTAVHVDFDQQTSAEPVQEPPPMKRVHVSNQLDILAELDGLRAGTLADSATRPRTSTSPEIDIDSLISGAVGNAKEKEIRRRVDRAAHATVFDQMRGVEFTMVVKDSAGNAIHTAEPVVVEVEGVGELTKLAIRMSIDLKNTG